MRIGAVYGALTHTVDWAEICTLCTHSGGAFSTSKGCEETHKNTDWICKDQEKRGQQAQLIPYTISIASLGAQSHPGAPTAYYMLYPPPLIQRTLSTWDIGGSLYTATLVL